MRYIKPCCQVYFVQNFIFPFWIKYHQMAIEINEIENNPIIQEKTKSVIIASVITS
jgi:hypothetical protein